MSPRRIVVASLLVYPVMAVLGLVWAVFRDRPWVVMHPEPWVEMPTAWRHGVSLAGGVLVAVGTVALSAALVRRFAWARELHLGFRETLGPLRGRHILVVALASGIGEEIFFRGALQPSIGWVAASVIFGIVHVGPSKRFWPWTVWALVFGFVVGALFEATGSIVGPIVAHVWINHENLHHIVGFDPREPAGDDRGGRPRLVGGESERR